MGRSDGGLDLSGLSGGNVTLRGGIAPVRAYAEGLMADVLAGTLAPGPTHGIGGEANQTVDDAALVSTPRVLDGGRGSHSSFALHVQCRRAERAVG